MSDVLARIAAANGAAVIPYEVPEWGIKCFIRPLSAAVWFGKMMKMPMAERMAEVIMYGLVNESGDPVLPKGAESMAVLVACRVDLLDRVSGDIINAGSRLPEEDDTAKKS